MGLPTPNLFAGEHAFHSRDVAAKRPEAHLHGRFQQRDVALRPRLRPLPPLDFALVDITANPVNFVSKLLPTVNSRRVAVSPGLSS